MLKNLLYLVIFTTFVVLLWIALAIYHNLTFSTISKDVSIQIIPINPSFETSVIDSLNKRAVITVDLSQKLGSPSALQPESVPTPSFNQGASSNASPSPTNIQKVVPPNF